MKLPKLSSAFDHLAKICLDTRDPFQICSSRKGEWIHATGERESRAPRARNWGWIWCLGGSALVPWFPRSQPLPLWCLPTLLALLHLRLPFSCAVCSFSISAALRWILQVWCCIPAQLELSPSWLSHLWLGNGVTYHEHACWFPPHVDRDSSQRMGAEQTTTAVNVIDFKAVSNNLL